jgi:hypothetical protein
MKTKQMRKEMKSQWPVLEAIGELDRVKTYIELTIRERPVLSEDDIPDVEDGYLADALNIVKAVQKKMSHFRLK